MRKNRPEQKNTKKTATASKTGANQKNLPVRETGERGQRGLHLAARYNSPLEDDPRKIQQSETERNEVSDPLEHKVSITQDIPLSRERTERD